MRLIKANGLKMHRIHGTWVCEKRVKPGVFVLLKEVKQGESENQFEKDNTCSLDDDMEGLEFLRQEQPMLCLKIYGIDAASGSAVSALNISPRDHVLDLCAKLCMILELLGNSSFVTGVDVARHRL
ncbi:S-adenosyl-L-methionine-dependent methyltransferase superfamily protein [Tanacetum coccineum]